ncbi:MAG: winged helix-turn-helix domain-containing protein [Candidatus Bathyarchaeota archaeon]|nr:winged helix-turn-helix domain-containing protein [Candidatus Bathyarchaeota archaeon]
MDYRALFRSALKQRILLSLMESGKKIAELKVELDTSETTILHALKEFEKLDLTIKNEGVYSLSSLGLMEAKIYQEYNAAIEVLEKFRDFWLNHNVEPIPSWLMVKLGSLRNSTIVKSEKSELGKVHETFMKALLESKRVKGASPIFHPDYVDVFKKLLSQGGSIELIITDLVLSKTLESAVSSADAELLQNSVAEGRLKIYLIDDLKIALTITDSIFSLGLFNLTGDYDYNMDLISKDPAALGWGELAFQEYVKRSRRLEF